MLDRTGAARDLAALALADLVAVKHRHVAGPGMAALAAGHAEVVALATHEQVELIAVDPTAGVVRDDAAVMDEAAPRCPTWHGPALEQRDIEELAELHDLGIDRD